MQDKLSNSFGLLLPTSKHQAVKALKSKNSTPCIHGNKVWLSSFALMTHLEHYVFIKKDHVLEIGCGWGPITCFLNTHKKKVKVTGLDADKHVEPYYRLTQKLNHQSPINFVHSSFEKIDHHFLAHFTILAGSDICFWDSMTNTLFELIQKAVKTKKIKHILIADPGRQPFWDLVDLCEDKFNAELHTIKLKKPKSSEKYILEVTT